MLRQSELPQDTRASRVRKTHSDPCRCRKVAYVLAKTRPSWTGGLTGRTGLDASSGGLSSRSGSSRGPRHHAALQAEDLPSGGRQGQKQGPRQWAAAGTWRRPEHGAQPPPEPGAATPAPGAWVSGPAAGATGGRTGLAPSRGVLRAWPPSCGRAAESRPRGQTRSTALPVVCPCPQPAPALGPGAGTSPMEHSLPLTVAHTGPLGRATKVQGTAHCRCLATQAGPQGPGAPPCVRGLDVGLLLAPPGLWALLSERL